MPEAKYYTIPVLTMGIDGVKTLGVIINSSIIPITEEHFEETKAFVRLMAFLSEDGEYSDAVVLN